MADPLLPNPSELDPADWIVKQQRSAQSSAFDGLEANPDEGARALELGKATGANPALVYGDLENFEKQHKAALTSSLLANNQFLRDYANSQPLASVVSANDWGHLDQVSQSLGKLTSEDQLNLVRGRLRPMLDLLDKVQEPVRPSKEAVQAQWGTAPPNTLFQNVKDQLGLSWDTIRTTAAAAADVNRPFAERALAIPAAAVGGTLQTAFAVPSAIMQSIGDAFERGSGGRVTSGEVQAALGMTGVFTGAHEGGISLEQAHAAMDQVAQLGKVVKPYLDAGAMPPVGVHPIVDQLHKEITKSDVKNLDRVDKDTEKTDTKEINADSFARFVRIHTDSSIEISAEAVRKLYGDKVPEADDNILGFVPDLAAQLQGAEAFGGRVQVPLADWLAHTDPEVRKALHDDVSVRPGGMTLNETKAPEPKAGAEPTKAVEKAPPIDTVDAVRRSAGLDPIAPGQMRLERAPLEEGEPGHGFDIQDGEGKRIGGLTIEEVENGKALNISSIAAGTKEGLPGFLGQRQMLGLLRQLQEEFPNAKRVEGWRVSGARPEHGFVSIPLRPSPKQLTDFMRSGFESQEVRNWEGKVAEVQPLYTTTLGEVLPPNVLKDQKVSDSPIMQHFADTIHRLGKDVPVHVISKDEMERVMGDPGIPGFHSMHTDGTSNIFLPDDVSHWSPEQAAHIIMHEGSHALTVAQIYSFPLIESDIRQLMDHVNDHLMENDPASRADHWYAFENEKEFIAEAQSKESFQEVLKSIPLSKDIIDSLGMRESATVWDAVKNLVRSLWEKITGKPVPETAMDAIFKISKDIEEAPVAERIAGGSLDLAPPKQLELPGLTRMEDREAFEKAAAIGMTVKQYRRYQELIEKRDTEDMEHFRAQAEKRERVRQTTEWKADEARVREETKTNLLNRPDIAVDNLLREGSLFGDKLKGRPRLDGDKLTAEQRSGLPEDYVKSGGVDPGDTATMFGYSSVDEMLERLKQLHKDRGELGPNEYVNKLAERITQERMAKEFGNLEQNILEESKDHVVSQSQLDLLHEELVALGSKFGGELSISKADVKAWVKKQFSEMPISMHRVDDYLSAAGRAGRGAEQALLDGDAREAFKFKQQQYVSMQMANEAKAYEKARASFDTLAKRLAKRELPNLPQDYVAHLRDQLLRAGLPIGRSVQALAEDIREAGDLTQFVQRASDGSQVPIFLPDWMYNSAWRKKLDTMTAGEFSEYSKGIRQLYNFGRDERKVEVAGDKIDLGEFLDKAKDQLSEQGERKVPYNPSKIGQLVGLAKNIFYGKLIQAETIFNRWDMGDPRGMFNENFMYKAAASANDLSARIKRYSVKVQEAGKLIKDMDLGKRLPNLLTKVTDGMPVNMTVENALRIITDMGNASNKDKFTRGWKVDPQALEGWLKQNTTKEMWDFAQALGDVHEEMFGELKDMVRSISGVVPDQLELQPFTDPHGIQRKGWYSPMIYDQVEMGTSRKLAGLPQIDPNEMTGLMNTGYFKSTTATGAEIQRTGYAAPTDLTLARLPQRMTQILYDTAFRPFVVNFGKVMRDQGFQNAITRHSGVEVRDMMRDWLNDIIGAGKGASTASDIASGQVIEYFRRNIIGQLIGWNLHTVEKHGLSALVNSMAEVGMGNFAREFQSMMLSPNAGREWDFAMSKSEELQRRRQHWTESLGGQFEAVRLGGQGWRDWMLEKGSSIVAWSDMASAAPSWMAEYKTQMANLAKERPDALPSEYEGVAISLADRAVRRAHGSTAITSRPGGMRGGAFARTFMSLYGFFNQMLQRNYEVMWRTKYAAENFKQGDFEKGRDNLTRAGVLFATATLWPALVEEMVTPYTNEERDSWGKWTGKTLALGMSATIPFVREFVHGWINNFETGAGILDTGWKDLRSSFDDLRKGTKMMDAEHGGKTIKDFNALVGVATGVTNNEVGNVMKTIWDSTHRSKESPKGIRETGRELITGHAKVRR